MAIQNAGFPDGHLTDLEIARARLYPPFIMLSGICCVYFFYIGLVEKYPKIGRRFLGCAMAYLLTFGITLAIDVYLAMTLDDGGGG